MHSFMVWLAVNGRLKTHDKMVVGKGLVIGAAIYFEWKERNIRTFQDKIRNVDVVCNLIKDTVRLRVLSLSLKDFAQVCDAAKILEFHVVRSGGKRRFPFMMVEVSQKLNVLKIKILICAINNGRPVIFMGSKKTVNLNMRYVKCSIVICSGILEGRWLKYRLKFVLERKELTLTLDDSRTIFQLLKAYSQQCMKHIAKQNVQKVKEHLIAGEIEKLVEGAENVENVEVDSSNLRQDDTQIVPDTRLEPMINKESPDGEITAAEQPINVIEEEEESSEDDYELRRRKKGNHVEESRSTCTQ
ncbi:hypothetical protein Tco_0098818 [Tanacetum coccineum]